MFIHIAPRIINATEFFNESLHVFQIERSGVNLYAKKVDTSRIN